MLQLVGTGSVMPARLTHQYSVSGILDNQARFVAENVDIIGELLELDLECNFHIGWIQILFRLFPHSSTKGSHPNLCVSAGNM